MVKMGDLNSADPSHTLENDLVFRFLVMARVKCLTCDSNHVTVKTNKLRAS